MVSVAEAKDCLDSATVRVPLVAGAKVTLINRIQENLGNFDVLQEFNNYTFTLTLSKLQKYC